MSSALIGAALVGGASFINADSEEYLEWQIWTVFALLYCALLTTAFKVPNSVLLLFILPTFIIFEAQASPPIGVGLVYTLLCLTVQ